MSPDRQGTTRLARLFSAFALGAGLTGVVVQVLTAPSTVRTITAAILFGLAAVMGAFFALPEIIRAVRARRSLPSEVDLDKHSTAYRVEQAAHDDIGSIAELEVSVYAGGDAVPEPILREWFAANPTGFSTIRTRDGRLAGHINLLPVRSGTLQQFVEGHIVEREIRGDSLHPPQERASIKEVYVESVILCPPEGRSPAAAMLGLLTAMRDIVDRVADWQALETIYAIAATASGERLLRKLGFELLRSAETRRDQHNLFAGRTPLIAKRVGALCGLDILTMTTKRLQRGL